MSYKSPQIIQSYVIREILGTTILCTLVLTAILLYGNLSKHDDNLFRALSISPFLFLEIISLMLPFAVSLGLPFGFSLAVIFCVGRWSSDHEIIAMQSLGVKRSHWVRPILILSFIISLLTCFSSLQWSPISRGTFEKRLKEMVWQDFQSWVDSGREINFDLEKEEGKNLISGLDLNLSQKMKRLSLSVGQGDGIKWKNVRILIWGDDRELLAILHAKNSFVSQNTNEGTVELFLEDVDYESFENEQKVVGKNSSFVSFKKWKTPLKFAIESPNLNKNIKRVPFLEFSKSLLNNELTDMECIQGLKQFNKYASIAFSPISICSLLIGVAIKKGRRETYANLFLGVFICLLFFVVGSSFGESFIPAGFGWWISNFLALLVGYYCIK